jgi:hypothetical protein
LILLIKMYGMTPPAPVAQPNPYMTMPGSSYPQYAPQPHH